MLILTYLSVLIGIISLIYILLIFLRRSASKNVRLFALFAIVISIWIFTVFLADVSTNQFLLIMWTKLATLWGVLWAYFFFIFVLYFRYPKNRNIYKVICSGIPALAIIIYILLLPDNELYVDLSSLHYFDGITPTQGVLGDFYSYYTLLIIFYICVATYLLLYKYKSLNFQTKRQVILIALGVMISIGGGIIFDVILPIYGYSQFYSLGTQFSVFFVLLTGYAIVKYRFLEIRTLIQRGVIFTVLFIGIIALYQVGLWFSGFVLQSSSHLSNTIIGAIITIFGIFTVGPIENFFRRITDRIFFKDKYDYKQVIDEVSRICNTYLTLSDIVVHASNILEATFKVGTIYYLLPSLKQYISSEGKNINSLNIFDQSSVDFMVKNKRVIVSAEILYTLNHLQPDKETTKKHLTYIYELSTHNDLGIIIPIIHDDQVLALLVLGNKKSGDVYYQQDVDLLKTIGSQLGTALRKAQLYEEVKEYSKTLEEKVFQRTARIQELQEAQRHMIEYIAHGLQTPLTVMKARLESLQGKNISQESIEPIEASLDEISKLIYDFLKLLRLESSASTKKEVVDFSDLVRDVTEYFGVLVTDRGIRLKTALEANCDVLGDRDLLEELVTNILSNALKYIGTGTQIQVVLHKTEDTITCRVDDTGIGIALDEQEKVFERFYRSKRNDTSVPGTGLGLAICKQIVENHGGRIYIKSELSKGTSVYIELPRYKRE